jgi:hypothetical protein
MREWILSQIGKIQGVVSAAVNSGNAAVDVRIIYFAIGTTLFSVIVGVDYFTTHHINNTLMITYAGIISLPITMSRNQ